MSEKDLPRYLKVIVYVSLVVCVNLILNTDTVFGNHLPSFSIASKSVFSTVCIDADGNTRNHMEEWVENSCDRRICVAESAEPLSYQVKYDCPPGVPFTDMANCQYVADSSLTFPDCCPELQCSNGTLPTNVVPACSDLSPTDTCVYWKSLTNCVNSADTKLAFVYNLTVDYCQETCGFCTPSG